MSRSPLRDMGVASTPNSLSSLKPHSAFKCSNAGLKAQPTMLFWVNDLLRDLRL